MNESEKISSELSAGSKKRASFSSETTYGNSDVISGVSFERTHYNESGFSPENPKIHAETSIKKENPWNTSFSEMNETISSQELAENAHRETKEDMIKEHGHCMSDKQIERLSADETSDRLTVMSSEDYTETFRDVDFNVLGHCDLEGNIYIKDISPEIVEHVSTHETIHLCANRENYYKENGDRVIVSGIHEMKITSDGVYIDCNRAANEGITEMYTLRELKERDKIEIADSLESYIDSRMWAERVEKLVGPEKMEKAYFGNGREIFEEEFNRLNGGDPEAWNKFSRDIDLVEYGSDDSQIEQAKFRLMSRYSDMVKNKYGLKG